MCITKHLGKENVLQGISNGNNRPCEHHNGTWRSGVMTLLVLEPGNRLGVSCHLYGLDALPPGKEPLLFIKLEARWPLSCSGHLEEKINLLPPLGNNSSRVQGVSQKS